MGTLPAHVAQAREPIVTKVLSHLPDELVSALAHGLERHAGRLTVGRLYQDHDGGGCAVGVMLRELTPSAYSEGRLRFLVRRRLHRSVLTEQVELERSVVTRLSHVEMCFDQTAKAMCEYMPETDLSAAADATGRWMAELCREQLRARNRAGQVGFFVPDDWQVQHTADDPGPQQQPGHVALAPALITHIRKAVSRDGAVRAIPVRNGEMPRFVSGRRGVAMPGVLLAGAVAA